MREKKKVYSVSRMNTVSNNWSHVGEFDYEQLIAEFGYLGLKRVQDQRCGTYYHGSQGDYEYEVEVFEAEV